ncbi:MAG: transposase [Anaerolineales bacterium]
MNKSKFDPMKHHRRSIRLKGYNYVLAGAYFVTIVTQGRECLFGEIVEGKMILNEAGQMVVKWWNELPNKFPDIILGAFVVMPDHFHGIIIIQKNAAGADLRVCPEQTGEHTGSPRPNTPLPQIIQWFKTMTTNEYIRGVKQLSWRPFIGKLWQRNYYEHIVRNEKDLRRITDYILANPSRWHAGQEHAN